MSSTIDDDGWEVVQRRDSKSSKKLRNEEWLQSEVIEEDDKENKEEKTKQDNEETTEQSQNKHSKFLQNSVNSLHNAWDSSLRTFPRLLERYNMKEMQEEMNRSFEHLRQATEEDSSEKIEEATNQVKDMLLKLKNLSEQIETQLPQKVLEITSNEKPTVTLKKKKSKRSKKSKKAKSETAPEGKTESTTEGSTEGTTEGSTESSHSLQKRSSVDSTSTSEDELVESTKPTFYPYSFTERPSKYDVDDFVKGDFMDKIQEDSFKGLYNFSAIYMITSIILLIINNLHQRGWLITFEVITCRRSWMGVISALFWCSVMFVHAFQYYFLWKLRNLLHLSYSVYFTLYGILQVIFAVTYSVIIWNSTIPPLTAVLPMMLMVIFALKGHSFIFTNYGMEKQTTEPIPNSFGHYCYFLLCPTLLYELDYPRTKTIRLGYILRTGGYMCIAFILMYIIMMQFVYPILIDTTTPILYRIIRSSLSAFVIWLLLFFSVFHCLLNIIAEITMFGDRLLYEDWWNSTTILEFWKKWNGPIHYWCLRHVYVETQVYGNVSKPLASLATFMVSGIAHELVCSVVFRKPSLYFFLGMVVQVPLQLVSKYFSNSRLGNIIVWISLFLGQPMLELSYCQDWFARYPSLFCYICLFD